MLLKRDESKREKGSTLPFTQSVATLGHATNAYTMTIASIIVFLRASPMKMHNKSFDLPEHPPQSACAASQNMQEEECYLLDFEKKKKSRASHRLREIVF